MMSKKKYLIKTKYGQFFANIWYDKKDRAYLASVPHLPEVVTFGKSLSDAKRMVKDALELVCVCAIGEGKVIIDDKRVVHGNVPKSGIVSFVP